MTIIKKPQSSDLPNQPQWFFEDSVPGTRHSNVSHGFLIDELIYKAETPFQDCLIFDNPVYGRVLVLDGIVQLSASDEHVYHEMIVHPPMFSHPDPQKVVIVGGGDGGTLREVLKHNPSEVVMIDIDRQFVEAAEQHLPALSCGAFSDPRVKMVFEDASVALKQYQGEFDVAIIDCNDAVGTSERLFEEDFYHTVSASMRADGVCTILAGSLLDEDFVIQTRQRIEACIGKVTGIKATIPCYHCGEFVFLMAAKSNLPSGPEEAKLGKLQTERGVVTKHWSPAIHHACQLLSPGSELW